MKFKVTMVVLIILVWLALTGVLISIGLYVKSGGAAPQVDTYQLFGENVKPLLSPRKDKCLFVQDNQILITETRTDRILLEIENNPTQRELSGFKWVNNDEILVSIKNPADNRRGDYLTTNFREFRLLNQTSREGVFFYSNGCQKWLSQQEHQIRIHYQNGSVWDTGVTFDFSECVWSNTDRYVMITGGLSHIFLTLKLKK